MANILGNAISGLGNLVTGGQQKNSLDSSQAAIDALNNLQTPDIETMKIHLQDLVSQGKITPEQANTFLQQNTNLAGISTNPADTQAQMEALQGLQKISNEGGLTPIDEALLGKIKTQEDTQARGAREAILQNAQSRGVGGSGVELASQMLNQQSAATDQSQRDLDVGALAQQRALEALIQGGQLGGQMQQTEFGQKAQVANAQDAINRFNAANQQSQENYNVGNINAAQQANLANEQNIANSNVGTANAQEQYNKNLPEVGYQNAYQKAGGTAAAYNNAAANQAAAGAQNQKTLGTVLSAGAVGASGGTPKESVQAAQGYYPKTDTDTNSDVRMKEDIEKFDPSEFLNSLTSYKYNYKKPEMGEGKHAGVMAQDLEKTEEGKSMVEDTPEGKKVDYGKGFNTLLASLVDVHHRVKDLEGAR